jgi:hypothetical protein
VDLRGLLGSLKEKGLVSSSMTANTFYDRLVDIGMLSFSVFLDSGYITRYSFHKDLADEKLLLGSKKRGFLSMSSSLNYQGLSSYRDDFVFVSQEQTSKNLYSHSNLTQKAIDNAFAKEYRRTHKIGQYNHKHIVFLEPKNTKDFAVVEVKGIRVSSINRALVEMIVNVQYFRNSKEVIDVFSNIKEYININEVFKVIEAFNFIYPYYQCIGYILEEIGFNKEELYKFKEYISEFDFYTDRNQEQYTYIPYWKMFVI